MLLSTRAARCAALMAELDELYPGVKKTFNFNFNFILILFYFLNTNIFWSVSERILYPRNTRTLPKIPVVGGQPIEEETCMVTVKNI